MENKIYLQKSFFGEKEKRIAENGDLKVSTFVYDSGVAAVRVANRRGYIIVLPFKGQQVWRAVFDQHELIMRNLFDEPEATNEFLKTYGGFMIHCGLTAMGNPSPEDTHVIHGELPCAPYRNAALLCGEDAGGRYVTVTGEYEFKIGFENAYRFRPECKLYEDGTVIHMTSNIENLRNFPMEYLYLCHINFRPVDGSRLVYSAKKENVYTHVLVPDNMNPEDKAKLEAYFEMLRKDVTCHENVGAEGQFYQPEIVFTVRYEQDEDGRGYCLQRLPDGYVHYVSHRPSQLPYGLRWISRMGEEDAMGMLLPATAEHNGYLDCKAKGYIRHLPPRGAVRFDFEAGLLCPESAQKVADKIESMLK